MKDFVSGKKIQSLIVISHNDDHHVALVWMGVRENVMLAVIDRRLRTQRFAAPSV